jgi:hypothetical protein
LKAGTKLLIAAILSLSVGIACASPLLISELNIRPWIKHVSGSTADFEVNVVYANFSVAYDNQNEIQANNPSIAYYVVINITNPSDLGARLLNINFAAAGKITQTSGMPFPGGVNGSQSGSGWEAEGAWVDGVWYNVTWVNGTYPYFNRDGIMEPTPFQIPNQVGHWIEGVQVYDRYVNGTLTATYLNMNGTWTDVTDRINVTRPEMGGGYSVNDSIVNEMHVFQSELPNGTSSTYTTTSTNGTTITVKENSTLSGTVYTMVGDGCFDNYWKPHESRLIALHGSQSAPWTSSKAVEALKSGNITLKTETFNVADGQTQIVNNTVVDTWSYATELKQIQLTQNGESYVYNTILNSNKAFAADQWGVEVFVKPGS